MNPEPGNQDGKIRITLDDLNRAATPPETAPGQPRSYGSIAESSALPAVEESGGSLFMKGWFYLGLAGLAGSLLAWAVCEPRFIDGEGATWANHVIFPLMLILNCVGFGTAEGIVEHSDRKSVV